MMTLKFDIFVLLANAQIAFDRFPNHNKVTIVLAIKHTIVWRLLPLAFPLLTFVGLPITLVKRNRMGY